MARWLARRAMLASGTDMNKLLQDFDPAGGAIISKCQRYRYCLWRSVGSGLFDPGKGDCLFVMLNPSTANSFENDPTIRRCIGFTERWGYSRLVVVNLFAWRSPDPESLLGADNPIGEANNETLKAAMTGCPMIICAWGANGFARASGRVAEAIEIAREAGRLAKLHHLGLTQDGFPRHPLYVRSDQEPIPMFPGEISLDRR